MKNFIELTEDNLEQIRTKIENTLRDHHHLFLGFFPNVEFKENAGEDDIIFHVRTGKQHLSDPDPNLPPDLVVAIRPNATVDVQGPAVENEDGITVTNLIRSTVEDYFAK